MLPLAALDTPLKPSLGVPRLFLANPVIPNLQRLPSAVLREGHRLPFAVHSWHFLPLFSHCLGISQGQGP